MEPLKFEAQIKKELNKREIQPSSESWGKLQARLDTEQPEKQRFLSWAMAAALAVIFFLLGTLWNETIIIDPPVIVEETLEAEPTPKKPGSIERNTVLIAEKEARIEEEEENTSRAELVPAPKVIMATRVIENPIVKVEKLPRTISTGEEANLAKISKFPITVSDAEIDALLAAAMSEIHADSGSYATTTVTADDLLNEVEYELDQSFRQKVFDVIKEGFSKAKTVIANRNY